jgi:hypothetical protein
MQTTPGRTLLGVILVVVGAAIFVLGFLVMAFGVPFGSLLAAAGGAAMLVGAISTLIVHAQPVVPGAPVCYICGGHLSWEGLSGHWWCPNCSQYR